MHTVDARLTRRQYEDVVGGRLIDSSHFRELLSVSMATFERMKSAGKLPKPIEFSRSCHRWRSDEVQDWLASGCPSQRDWETMKKTARR